MSCTADRLEARLDEELDAVEVAELERHLAQCADCTAALARLREQKERLRAEAPYYPTPARLEESIRRSLRRQAAAAPADVRETRWRRVALAAALALALLGAVVTWTVAEYRSSVAVATLESDLLTAHFRSLIGEHLLDVPSADQHTVKPWFAGKLDFSPEVKDLAAEGFPLIGGRIDYLAGRRVAALVFRRRQHIINLFTWPASAPGRQETRITRDGVHLLHWSSGAMTYWAASDVAAPELERLRDLYRSSGQ